MKTCSCCHLEKEESEFGIAKHGRGGLQAACKQCYKEKRTLNKEHIANYHKEYYKNNILKITIKRK